VSLEHHVRIEAEAIRALRAASIHERVLLVEAGPGWGKTTAARMAFPTARYIEVPPGRRRGAFHNALLNEFGFSPSDAGSVVARLGKDNASVTQSVLAGIPPRTWLIVDDVQRLDDDGADLVAALVESQELHLVLLGRSMSSLPTGAWMSRGLAGMPFGPDTLAFRIEHIDELFTDLSYSPELLNAIVTTFAGWPLAATLAASMLRRGHSSERIVADLGDGVATAAATIVRDLSVPERGLLVEAALMSTYGIAATSGHLGLLRRLGFAESATGLHEVLASTLMKSVDAVQRAAIAQAMSVDHAEPSAVFSLLAAEAPDALHDRAWDLLAPLHDRYDAVTLAKLAIHRSVHAAAAATARCFLLALSSRFEEAVAIAHQVIDDAVAHSAETALRLARTMLMGGKGNFAIPALRRIEDQSIGVRVYRDALIGSILGEREHLVAAVDLASKHDNAYLIAFASVYVAYAAATLGHLEDAEGFAARGADAARAAGSIILEARALKIRYGVAQLRANLDLAAVHVGRLISLQSLVADPHERSTDLVAALSIEVMAGRPGRALAFDAEIRKIGHSWIGMESYVVCRAIMDAWEGNLLPASDRLATYANAVAESLRRVPLSLAALLATAAGATERGTDLLRQIPPMQQSNGTFAQAHQEMAVSFEALALCLLNRKAEATRRLAPTPKTPLGAVFIESARTFVGHGDAGAYAEQMRGKGFDGMALMIEACSVDAAPHQVLSRAERSVLSYLASGLDAARIAALTGRSPHTIKNQRRSIISKLSAANTLEAIAIARRLGII
jgi:DNA-binding CsgD family transcriptional regulator